MNVRDKILFVDDDGGIRLAFARSLQREGFLVDVAADASTALSLAKATPYGVIVLDYCMPGTSGLDLHDRMRDILPDSTFMLVSGACDLDITLDAVNEHGISYVIQKPWIHEDLVSKLNRALEQAWERSASQRLVQTMVELNSDPGSDVDHATIMSRGTFARALLRLLDLREPATRRHCERTAHYARLIGLKMKVSQDVLRDVELAARLHDVGKLVVPSPILNKPGALSEAEWDYIHMHPRAGADIVGDLPGMQTVRDLILSHHERWDGQGYPNKLKGEAIAVGARIIAVADSVDAMLSDRPHKAAMSLAATRDEVARCAGAQFAPEVAQAFLALPLRDEEQGERRPGQAERPVAFV